MQQVLFRIPFLDVPIYGYGLMLVLGMLSAIQLAKWLARRCGLDAEAFVTAGLIALVSGVAGARISHVLENLPIYTRADLSAAENLWNMINIRSGGLTFYGGFILATFAALAYGRYKRVNLRLGMDIVAPAVTLGLAFGRIGCFLNGCCWGEVCDDPWGVRFPYSSPVYRSHHDQHLIPPAPPELTGVVNGQLSLIPPERFTSPRQREAAATQHSLPVHATQLYSAFNSLLMTALLVAFFTLRPAGGRVFALMLVLEGFSRFMLESIRIEPPVIAGLSLSMVIGLLLVAAGAVMWWVCGRLGVVELAVRPLGAASAAQA